MALNIYLDVLGNIKTDGTNLHGVAQVRLRRCAAPDARLFCQAAAESGRQSLGEIRLGLWDGRLRTCNEPRSQEHPFSPQYQRCGKAAPSTMPPAVTMTSAEGAGKSTSGCQTLLWFTFRHMLDRGRPG